jgi:hypothetical protein
LIEAISREFPHGRLGERRAVAGCDPAEWSRRSGGRARNAESIKTFVAGNAPKLQ